MNILIAEQISEVSSLPQYKMSNFIYGSILLGEHNIYVSNGYCHVTGSKVSYNFGFGKKCTKEGK